MIGGQLSWSFSSSTVKASVTEQGGHLAPVVFDRTGRKIKPYTIPPWSKEKLPDNLPQMLKVLRGDFFCMPFGGNESPYGKEKHLPHGETANKKWKFKDLIREADRVTIHLRMKPKVRRAVVDKKITVVDGHNAVYSRHIITGMSGKMTFGHHPTVRFPDKSLSGVISTSRIKYGMVSPQQVENPENRGYSCLQPGMKFERLNRVQMITGEYADLSRYPARRGFEDIVMLVTAPCEPFAWTAVTFPEERYVWFSLKDPAVLKQTLLWMSNGGRHYAPWNGRHINIMGMEELTSYFHYGLAESVQENCINKLGDDTYLEFNPDKPQAINFITAAVEIPDGFDCVKNIEPGKEQSSVILTANSGVHITVPIEYNFLKSES